MTNQYLCRDCGAVVVIPSHIVLSPTQQAIIAERKCHDCAKIREVKSV